MALIRNNKPAPVETIDLSKVFVVRSYKKKRNTSDLHLPHLFFQELLATQKEEIKALQKVNIKIDQGEFVGLFGPNGSGKTTLLRILSGFTYPTEGKALIFGHDVKNEREKVMQLVNYIPGLLVGGVWIRPEMTARRNLLSVAEMFNIPKKRVDEALEAMGLERVAERRVGTFSSGMVARLLLAFGLLRETPIMLLDEPTTGISPETAADLLDHLRKLNRNGTTIIYATHRILEIEKLCSKVYILDKGRVIAQGSPQQLIRSIGKREAIQMRLLNFGDGVERALREMPGVERISIERENESTASVRLQVISSKEVLPRLIHTLVKAFDCRVESLKVEEPNLQDVYMYYAGRRGDV